MAKESDKDDSIVEKEKRALQRRMISNVNWFVVVVLCLLAFFIIAVPLGGQYLEKFRMVLPSIFPILCALTVSAAGLYGWCIRSTFDK